jgi:hypothetical protein
MIEREFDCDAETTGRLCQFIVNVHRSFSKNEKLHIAAQLEGVALKIPREAMSITGSAPSPEFDLATG